nr:MAG TPA: hypothetical protein [Caudoviricetes sp.]
MRLRYRPYGRVKKVFRPLLPVRVGGDFKNGPD